MKRSLCLLMALMMLMCLAACGQEPAEEVREWSRNGYFTDENENFLSVIWLEDVDEPGWNVGVMLEETMAGCIIPQEGNSLHGNLNAWDSGAEPFVVTISEEGEDGLRLQVEGGETYHFKPYEMPKATIFVTVGTEGEGNIDYAVGEEAPEIDPEYPVQSAQINLAEPETHTLLAWPRVGSKFVKWQKNGEDFSTEPQITVLLDESADFVAVFEEDAGWQNPVMNFVGEYQSGRAHATVECWDKEEAWITIEWGSSAWELTRWLIVGKLDPETATIAYEGSNKANLTYDENGELKSEEEIYQDGTGTIAFHDGGFTWHEDQSEYGEDLEFEWVAPAEENLIGMANPWRTISEEEAWNYFTEHFVVPENAENAEWSVMESADANPLLQLAFDLDGQYYIARMQATDDAEADISGMYFDWADQQEHALSSWADGKLTAKTCRFVSENEEDAELCTWFDEETGISYSVGVLAEDLDGFDLLAIVENMAPRK